MGFCAPKLTHLKDQKSRESQFIHYLITAKKNIDRAYMCPISHSCLERCDFGNGKGIFDPVFDESGMQWNPLISFFERLVMRMNCRALCAIEQHDGTLYHQFIETAGSKNNPSQLQDFTYKRSMCSEKVLPKKQFIVEKETRFHGMEPCELATAMEEALEDYHEKEKGCRFNCDPQRVGSFLSRYFKLSNHDHKQQNAVHDSIA